MKWDILIKTDYTREDISLLALNRSSRTQIIQVTIIFFAIIRILHFRHFLPWILLRIIKVACCIISSSSTIFLSFCNFGLNLFFFKCVLMFHLTCKLKLLLSSWIIHQNIIHVSELLICQLENTFNDHVNYRVNCQ